MRLFVYDSERDLIHPVAAKEADRDWRHTDVNDKVFLVQADDLMSALSAGREWVSIRADDDINDMGDLAFVERDPHRSDCRAYTILTKL